MDKSGISRYPAQLGMISTIFYRNFLADFPHIKNASISDTFFFLM